MLNFIFMKKVPVFFYHSMVAGTDCYLGNDHIALASDLGALKEQGYQPISIADVVEFAKGNYRSYRKKLFAITFDDAPILDYFSYKSPTLGTIKPFKDILIESKLFDNGAAAMSFAIASEKAREELDRTCMQGNGDWGSQWWKQAIDSGVFEIGNHSLDHLHSSLEHPQHSRLEKGNFMCVDNYQDADTQIRRAQDQLAVLTDNTSSPYFAYPYGEVSEYLQREYFPNYSHEHKQLAAFTTEGRPVVKGDNIWTLPRFVCGDHWQSPEEFLALLK